MSVDFQAVPSKKNVIRMLGTHGVPAAYGGFETAVEHIALHLVTKGWRVIVYCQTHGDGPITEDMWNGVERVLVPTNLLSWKGTGYFDWICYRHAMQFDDPCAVFGYNTGLLNILLRARGIPTVINMDGIEWKRERWSLPLKVVLYINERFAAWFGTHLIADHPEIARHLESRAPAEKITTITYGADPVTEALVAPLEALGLVPGGYMTLIARPVPENSIMEIVTGFSARRRGVKLVILGKYDFEHDPFHRRVHEAASNEVVFVGTIFDKSLLRSLRFYSLCYLHGHRVGGTNPSLVEALGAGNAVVAHDNPFNRWVADEGALYFANAEQADACISRVIEDGELRERMRATSSARFHSEFEWSRICGQYEELLLRFQPR